MLAKFLLLAGVLVIGLMGAAHLLMTFHSQAFRPRDALLESHMRDVAPRLSAQTSMWKAWVGFNASHSLGILLFAVVYAWLGLCHPQLLFQGRFAGLLGTAVLGSYLALAWRYWYSGPLLGIALASLLYASAFLVARL